jgi:hypothetical protein
MTRTEVLTIATSHLKSAGYDVAELKFSHMVFTPEGTTAAGTIGETWLVYFVLINPPPDGLTDYNGLTVGVDEATQQAHVI